MSIRSKILFLLPAVASFLLVALAAEEKGCRLTCRIVNQDGETIPARAWIQSGKERLFQPFGPDTATPYARDRSFSCDGEFTILIPTGETAVLHIEKGKEYKSVNLPVHVAEETTIEKTVLLKRWVNMAEEGWYSADLHVHLGQDDPHILGQLALADDVNLIPAFTYWLRGRGETWNDRWPDPSYSEAITVDSTHLVTRNNLEIERINRASVPGGYPGATFLFNLAKPVTADAYGEHFPTDAALCRSAGIQSSGMVVDCDKPSWAGTVVTAGLDELDVVQLCHNHFHREATLPGGWGMIGPLVEGESNAAEEDQLFHRTNAIYYRLLNCGCRLGVSGGSAIGVMPVATGQQRVYARVTDTFTVENFWKALKAGQSFATSGPMLDFSADGKAIGSILPRKGSEEDPVNLETTVRSVEHIESLQILENGIVIASREDLEPGDNGSLTDTLNFEISPNRSGWVAARALFRAPDGRLRQAHTSPIYLVVDEKPIAFADDAHYMIRWLEILDEIARSHPERFPSAAARESVLSDYAEAKARYQAVVEQARKHWDD